MGSLHAQTPVKQINAGGAAVAPFAADNSFSAGSTFSSAAAINLTGVTNPAPQAVYQSVRWNASFNYTLTGLTAGSSYQVRLHFVELSFTAAGQRKFNVAINGTAVLTAFDIFAQAGQNHALVQQFNATANSSGQIVVAFSQGGADNPSIAGIEVLTAAVGRSPYGGSNWPINNGATIQAENYDLGGEGVAYHDADVANTGGQYRTDGVDIEATTDTGTGYNVGWINDAEWLDYTVNSTAGTYNIVVRGASGASPAVGSVKVLLDGVVLGTVAIPNTGGWQTWQDFTISNVAISAGTGRTLQLQFVGGGFNVNYVRFATTTATFPLTVTSGTGSGNYAAGTVVNIVANAPGAGQVFSGWTGGTAANFANATSASTTYTTTGAAQTITATYSTVPTFALTVSSGTGSGNYPTNTVVNIVANAPGAGQVFAGWTGGTAANFGNATLASTTYKTTGAAQTITATYSTVPTFALTVSSGSGSGNYATNTVVNIVANAPGAGQVFASWSGGTAANFGNAASASTTYKTTGAAQTITATYTTSTGSNLAVGKPITASSSNGGFPVTNANDNNVTTYWESASIPATLTIDLGANANVTSVVVNLNPASSWGNRTQTIQVLGHNQSSSTFTSLVAATSYAFSPTTGNTVTIPVTTTASQIQLAFTSNSGAPGAQAAEFQIIGTAAPTFALTVNSGSGSGNYSAGTVVSITANAPPAGQVFAGWTGGTAANFGNAAAASTIYTTTAAAQTLTATYTANSGVVATPSFSPAGGTYASAQNVTITSATSGASIRYTTDGSTPSATSGTVYSGPVNISSNTTLKAIAYETNFTDSTVTSATYTITTTPPPVGVGATTPFVSFEAEAGTLGNGASVVTLTAPPTNQFASPVMEASGHAYVQLTANGQNIQWTNNTGQNITAINLRSSIPDAPSGGGITSTINLYVNGTFRQAFNVSSQQNYCYEGLNYNDQTNKSPSAGNPRFFWNDTHAFVTGAPIAPGSTFSFQKDSANSASFYYIDVVDVENPPPALTQPANSLSITNYGAVANNSAVDNTSAINNCFAACKAQGKIAWIPAGTWYFSAVNGGLGGYNANSTGLTIEGAGPWYSVLYRVTPANNTQGVTNIITTQSSTMENLALDCNSVSRAGNNNNGAVNFSGDNWKVNNIWIQHVTSAFWCGGNNGIAENCRSTSIWSDGGNFNNVEDSRGIGNNLTYYNNFVRGAGDDSMAINSVNYNTDSSGNKTFYTMMSNVTYQNNTAVAPWGGKGMGIYGGINCVVKNNLLQDTARYLGLGVMKFGVNGSDMLSATVINNTILRCGGNGYNQQQQAMMIGNGGDGQGVGTVQNAYIGNNTITNALYDAVGFSSNGLNNVMQNNVINAPGLDGIAFGNRTIDLGTCTGDAILLNNTVNNLPAGRIAVATQSSGYPVYTPVMASSFNTTSTGIITEACSEGGLDVGSIANGSFTEYNNVNLAGIVTFIARVASAGSGGNIQVHLDSPTGPLIGTSVVPVTGGWQTWTDTQCNISGASGVHNVYLVFTGGSGNLFNLQWFSLTQTSSI